MHRKTKLALYLLGAVLVLCATAVVVVVKHGGAPNNHSALAPGLQSYSDGDLGFSVTLPQPWTLLSATESAMVSSAGRAALAGSGHDLSKLGINDPDDERRVLTAMNPTTGDSFQILKQKEPSSVDESKPETFANDLRSTFLRLLPMQPLGSVERFPTRKPVAHFNGILNVKGAPVYQSVFVVMTRGTAVTFVFSGSTDSVLPESKRSFREWVYFSDATARP